MSLDQAEVIRLIRVIAAWQRLLNNNTLDHIMTKYNIMNII